MKEHQAFHHFVNNEVQEVLEVLEVLLSEVLEVRHCQSRVRKISSGYPGRISWISDNPACCSCGSTGNKKYSRVEFLNRQQ